jgi:hypothetical protein
LQHIGSNPVYNISGLFRRLLCGSRVALMHQFPLKTSLFAKMKAQDLSDVLTDV